MGENIAGGAAVSKRLTEFEIKVLNYAKRTKRLPLGNKNIAWAGAASRLQKRGLLYKLSGGGWHISRAGEAVLADAQQPEAHP